MPFSLRHFHTAVSLFNDVQPGRKANKLVKQNKPKTFTRDLTIWSNIINEKQISVIHWLQFSTSGSHLYQSEKLGYVSLTTDWPSAGAFIIQECVSHCILYIGIQDRSCISTLTDTSDIASDRQTPGVKQS